MALTERMLAKFLPPLLHAPMDIQSSAHLDGVALWSS